MSSRFDVLNLNFNLIVIGIFGCSRDPGFSGLRNSTFALSSNGTVFAWGDNQDRVTWSKVVQLEMAWKLQLRWVKFWNLLESLICCKHHQDNILGLEDGKPVWNSEGANSLTFPWRGPRSPIFPARLMCKMFFWDLLRWKNGLPSWRSCKRHGCNLFHWPISLPIICVAIIFVVKQIKIVGFDVQMASDGQVRKLEVFDGKTIVAHIRGQESETNFGRFETVPEDGGQVRKDLGSS